MDASRFPKSLKQRVLEAAAAHARRDPAKVAADRQRDREEYKALLDMRIAEVAQGPGPGQIFRMLRRAGVPEITVRALQGNFETLALEAATDWWATRPKPLLLLMGNVGSGKSVAAAALLARWLEKSRPNQGPTELNPAEPGLWVQAKELDSLSEYRAPDKQRVEDMVRCGFLVLDDLSEERLADNAPALGHIQHLLKERLGRKKPTVATTNLKDKQFEERYGARIWSRVIEGGDVRGSGDHDYRREGAGVPQKPRAVR